MNIDAERFPLIIQPGCNKEVWENSRRKEILRMFSELVYGKSPLPPEKIYSEVLESDDNALEGKAIKKIIKVGFNAPRGFFSFPLTMYVSKIPDKKVPAFLLINIKKKHMLDLSQNITSEYWPVEYIVSRGYAAVHFDVWDIDTDTDDGFVNGIIPYFQDVTQRKPDDWATIAAWAYGASRAMDYLETDELIDASKVAVIGHSRGGKTALWCSAQDERFYLTISNNSGCTGAAVSRGKVGETVKNINDRFPYWFCENYKKFNNKEDSMPFDQHMLLALIAPRLLYVASATKDTWADPKSEFLSCVLAEEIYKMYGLKGLEYDGDEELPPPEHPLHNGSIGYHLRTGGHDLFLYDWKCYLDFADKKLKG